MHVFQIGMDRYNYVMGIGWVQTGMGYWSYQTYMYCIFTKDCVE